MFIHKINEDLALKLIQPHDAQRVFALTELSRENLRTWLPWLDTTTKLQDTQQFIQFCLKGFSENTSLTTVILFKGEIVGVVGFNSINWANKTAYIGYWLGTGYECNDFNKYLDILHASPLTEKPNVPIKMLPSDIVHTNICYLFPLVMYKRLLCKKLTYVLIE